VPLPLSASDPATSLLSHLLKTCMEVARDWVNSFPDMLDRYRVRRGLMGSAWLRASHSARLERSLTVLR